MPRCFALSTTAAIFCFPRPLICSSVACAVAIVRLFQILGQYSTVCNGLHLQTTLESPPGGSDATEGLFQLRHRSGSILNGRFLGKRSAADHVFVWEQVALGEGVCDVRAVGEKRGEERCFRGVQLASVQGVATQPSSQPATHTRTQSKNLRSHGPEVFLADDRCRRSESRGFVDRASGVLLPEDVLPTEVTSA